MLAVLQPKLTASAASVARDAASRTGGTTAPTVMNADQRTHRLLNLFHQDVQT